MESVVVKALLDTHALVWARSGDPRLGPQARRIIETSPPEALALSDISLLELALLLHKGKVVISGSSKAFLNQITRGLQVLPIEAGITHLAMDLPLDQSDPFDRTIVATARHHHLPLLTRDRLITESGFVETVW